MIVLGPHLGNWELLGMHLVTLGNLAAIYEPIPLKKLDLLVHRGCQGTGGKLVPTSPRWFARCEPAVLPVSCLIKFLMMKMQASMRLFLVSSVSPQHSRPISSKSRAQRR